MRFQVAALFLALAFPANADAPAAPSGLKASIVSPTEVRLTWDAVSGADSYEVRRNGVSIATSATNAFDDTGATAGAVHSYNVRGTGPGGTSGWSAAALAQTVTFTEETLIPRLTTVKAPHVLQLRDAVNALRSTASLPPAAFTDASLAAMPVRAIHVTELRASLDSARNAHGLPPLTYTNALTASGTPVRAVDLAELRGGVVGDLGDTLFWNSVVVPAATQSLACSATHVFAGAPGVVRRSGDGGTSWSAGTGLPAGTDVTSVVAAGGGFVFAQTANDRVHRSSDDGATWTELAATPSAFTSLFAAPNGLFALGGACGSVWFSASGASWSLRSSGISGCVTSLTRTSRGRLYAGTAANGVFVSMNDAVSWTPAGTGIPAGAIHAVAADREQRVFVATRGQGVFRSTDEGASWSSVAAGDFSSLIADSTGALVAGSESGARIHRSSDGGVSWPVVSHGLPSAGAIDALCSTHRHRFAATDGKLFRAAVEFRLHGLNFSPFIDGQGENSVVPVAQLLQRMQIVRPHTRTIRSFRVSNGLQHIPRIARTLGLRTLVGARITANLEQNEAELAALIAIGRAGDADFLAVGNEVLLPTPPLLPVSTIVSYVQRVQAAVPGVPVTYVDGFHIYLANQPLRDAVDVVFASFYPFWDPNGVAVDDAIGFIDTNYQLLRAKVPGKQVVVSEAGWPSADDDGSTTSATPANAAQHFREFESWARATGTDAFYFSAFDEQWKTEGGVGPHWGVWDRNGVLKPLDEPVLAGEWTGTDVVGGPGAASVSFTNVPAYNTYGTLRGQVQHIVPNEHRVAVYIRVGGGWWTKPYADAPLTWIRGNGTWASAIVTHENDLAATEIAAYVLPAWYTPPAVAGAAAIPGEVVNNAVASVQVTRSP